MLHWFLFFFFLHIFFTLLFVTFESIWSVKLNLALNRFLMTTTFFCVCVHPELLIERKVSLLDL